MHTIWLIDNLEKGKIISNEYYMVLLDQLNEEIKKNHPQMPKKKVLFHQDIHSVISCWKWRSNWMNCASNCFFTHCVVQIRLLVTTGCLQTSKKFSKERSLAQKKKWLSRLKPKKAKTNHLGKIKGECIILEGEYLKTNFA